MYTVVILKVEKWYIVWYHEWLVMRTRVYAEVSYLDWISYIQVRAMTDQSNKMLISVWIAVLFTVKGRRIFSRLFFCRLHASIEIYFDYTDLTEFIKWHWRCYNNRTEQWPTYLTWGLLWFILYHSYLCFKQSVSSCSNSVADTMFVLITCFKVLLFFKLSLQSQFLMMMMMIIMLELMSMMMTTSTPITITPALASTKMILVVGTTTMMKMMITT